MPLLRFDIFEGWTDTEVQAMLDASHRAMLKAFQVPVRDRYQIVNKHSRNSLIIEDTGLDIERTDKVVFIQVTTRPRSREAKSNFYKLLVDELLTCGIPSSDVVVSVVVNDDEDWSFGHGRAQFLTGEL